MTLSFMLDTNIVSSLMREPVGRVSQTLRELGDDRACMSVVTAGELRYGALRVASRRLNEQVERALLQIPPVALDLPADEMYASVRVALEQVGRPIGPNDILIAAHALALNLILVTANHREFSRVPGLKVENWLD